MDNYLYVKCFTRENKECKLKMETLTGLIIGLVVGWWVHVGFMKFKEVFVNEQ